MQFQKLSTHAVENLLSNYGLYCEQDEWIGNHIEGHSRWCVRLDNDLWIYQDDHRKYPQFNDERLYSTWTRLRNYCYENKISIVEMRVQFRSNIHILPVNADGYYFCKSIMLSPSGENWHFFMTGVVENGIIQMREWRIPEMAWEEIEPRQIDKSDIRLILREDLR